MEGGSLYSSGVYTASVTLNKTTAQLAASGLASTTLAAISGKFVTGADYIDSQLATAAGRERLSNYSFSSAKFATDQGEMYIITARGVAPFEPKINVSVSQAKIKESGKSASFILTLGKVATDELIVKYSLSGTAKRKTDYTGPGSKGYVEIPKGVKTFSIPIRPLDDEVDEKAETVVLKLLRNDGYKRGATSTATITITDND